MKKHLKKIVSVVFLGLAVAFILNLKEEKAEKKPTTVAAPTLSQIPPSIPMMIESKSATISELKVTAPDISPIPQNRPWRTKVEQDLLAFMPAETTVKIEVLDVLDQKIKQDVAKITYKKKDGATSSFKALIETRSGKILRTWDQAIFEPDPHKKTSIVISGAL